MSQPAPATIGMAADEVDTPALLVDLDAFARNLSRMATFAGDAGLKLRPHAKTHKCAVIARKQMALGAVGVCCQKVGEAEAMVRGGVDDVLVSNQVVGTSKLRRLAALAADARIGVCVDDAENINAIAEAAVEAGTNLDVLVEIDVGAGRCGVEPGAAAVDLAKRVADAEALCFRGLQAYHGSAQHIRDHDERGAAIENAARLARETAEALSTAGLECEDITGAGTGSHPFEAASGVYTELQCGSYIFMDADYAQNRMADGDLFDDYENSLHVLATVMSTAKPGRAVVDTGHKALGNDQGMPTIADLEGAEYTKPSDEHGTIILKQGDNRVRLGDKLRLVPGHCDPTVNLYDWFVGIRDGRVAALWPIAARGAAQ